MIKSLLINTKKQNNIPGNIFFTLFVMHSARPQISENVVGDDFFNGGGRDHQAPHVTHKTSDQIFAELARSTAADPLVPLLARLEALARLRR